MTVEQGKEIIERLITNVELIIRGKRDIISLILTGILAGGHVLLEDYPGCGKTTLAKSLSYSIGSDDDTAHKSDHIQFKRIQFTPDLLPSDILGVNIYNQKSGEFYFSPGPVFSNIVLADEINRTSPKVQSALLESMAEKQVTVDNETYHLDEFFFVIGTQNPLEMAGTYTLPLVQLDRFMMKLDIGYIDGKTEREVLKDYNVTISKPESLKKVCSRRDILALRELAQATFCEEEVYDCIVEIVQKTREHPTIRFGASTRSGIMLLQAIQAYALIQGRDYVVEDDIKVMAPHVLGHRILFREGAKVSREILDEMIMDSVSKLTLSNAKFMRGKPE